MAKKEKEEKREKLVFTEEDSMDAIVDSINEVFGVNTMVIGTQALTVTQTSIPTGIAAFDLATGGGLPENRMTELSGGASSLKTTTLLCGMAQFHRRYKNGEGLMVDVEKAFDAVYARSLGVDLNRLHIITPDSGEQAVDTFLSLIRLGRPIYLGFDSIGMISTTAEAESSTEQKFMGGASMLIGRMMRVGTAAIKRSLYNKDEPRVTIVFLNQLRDNVGISYGDPIKTPGGQGKEFAYSLKVRLRSSASKKIMEIQERNGIKRELRVGQSVDFTVTKNKVGGSQFEEGAFNFYVRPFQGRRQFSFDNEGTLFDSAVFYGVIERELIPTTPGKFKEVFSYDEYHREKADTWRKLIRDDQGLYWDLFEATLAALRKEYYDTRGEIDQGNGSKVKLVKKTMKAK